MAKNDAILLDGIIEAKMTLEFLDKGETFELFTFEQILKSFDLTREEIQSGWVDGKDDGGVDGFYTFLNGILVRDTDVQIWPKKAAVIDIWILSCKHRDAFKQEALNTVIPTIEELLDFSKSTEDFSGKYSVKLIRARQIATTTYLRTASGLPSVNFHFAFATRGDVLDLGENISARGQQIRRIVSDYFSSVEVSLEFFGASELIELHRKTRVILELPYAEQLSGDQGAFVLLVPITAYANFVSDEHGNLRRYLFDSNVRDFLGSNRVNQDIAGSLLDRDSPDFWWLNNGVTILATSALPLGRTPAGNAIQLHDVQIVNGLQTTQTIHSYIQSYDGASETRCVLVKVIVSEDSAVRDKIIEATNNQTSVELAALNATDKIQRDIEQILERNQWYYERRKNYYKNIGKPAERFVTPLWLAASVVALLKRAPHAAGQLKNRFMRNQVSYRAVFSDRLPIEVWPRLVGIMKAVEFGIVAAVPRLTAGQASFLKSARGAVALCAVARLRGTFDIDAQTLLAMDPQKVTSDLVWSVFECLYGLQHVAASSDTALQYPHSRVRKLDRLCVRLGELEGILGTAVIGRWVLPTGAESKRRASGKPADAPWFKTTTHTAIVSDEVLAKVDAELPEQPWPPGIQQKVAEALGFDRKTVAGAIKQLMESGKRYWQRMGVAIDHEGIVVAVDRKRAAAHHIVGKPYSGE